AALVIRRPVTGFYMLAVCVVLIDQAPLLTPVLTDRLYIFYWPRQLEGLIDRPIGFFALFVVLMLVCHNLVKRRKLLQGNALLLPFVLYLLCVVVGVVHGLTSGGNLKTIVLEIRPFWYMFLSYMLAYNLVTRKEHIRNFLWIVILGAGVKALQGVYIYLIVLKGSLLGHREIMAHEESFFFIALILLVVMFCLHYRYRPQLIAALLVLPFLIVALIANQRRADYIALLIGILVAWTLIFCIKPQSRKGLAIGMVICALIGGIYVAAFAGKSGGFAEPARAIVSIFHPDPADASSNLYRTIENYDLKYTVRQNPLLGLGFGKPFLQPVTLPNILIEDPYYLYVPHNTIYWVWMRLGALGYSALWYLVGAIIIRGCLIARRLRDPYLQLMAVYIVAVTCMEIVVAYADYQLFFYRNVIYLGLLVGILMKLPLLDKKDEVVSYEAPGDVSELPAPNVGRRHA
ncbi:MAG: O-antigen ligase family protein, partial [Ktedonobacteraceae bacterium]